MTSPVARLEISGLSKTFGEARVLADVGLSVAAGEIHGLVGQNGCGKSTLIKVLTGYHAPDGGARYLIDGQPLSLPVRWKQAHAAGVSVVHQDLGLLDELSVAENICVGGFPTHAGRIDRARSRQMADRVLRRLSVDLDPAAAVGTLTASQRAEVAVARALRDERAGSGLTILDESTRAFSGIDLERFHAMLRRIADAGGSVLMISHNLPEVLSVCDRVSVLRDGQMAAAGISTTGLDEPGLARLMLGRAVPTVVADVEGGDDEPAQEATVVSGLCSEALSSIDVEVGHGEVVGITGLPGSGYEEIAYLLSGARRASAGQVRLGSTVVDLRTASVRACIRAGIVLVPERREREGLAFDQSISDNISLPTIRRRGHAWHVGRGWQDADASAAIETLDIKPRRPMALVKQLSGGNQQKVLLAKWLTAAPSLLLLHEPTQAVDVGARHDILTAIKRAARAGMGVVIVSSEPLDLVAVCDRILLHTLHGPLEEIARDVDVIIDRMYGAAVPEHA